MQGRQAIKQNNIMGLFQIIRRWNRMTCQLVMFKESKWDRNKMKSHSPPPPHKKKQESESLCIEGISIINLKMFQTDEPMIYFGPTVISQIQHTCIQKFVFWGCFFLRFFCQDFLGVQNQGKVMKKIHTCNGQGSCVGQSTILLPSLKLAFPSLKTNGWKLEGEFLLFGQSIFRGQVLVSGSVLCYFRVLE